MRFLAVLCLALFFVGCGRGGDAPLAQVSGVVQIDGKPAVGILVRFQPISGRPSIGVTNGQGAYSLQYAVKQPGALVGDHDVSLEYDLAGDATSPEVGPDAANEKALRDAAKGLKATVKPGANTIDFNL